MKEQLTQAEVLAHLDYNPDTGVLTWRHRLSNDKNSGKRAGTPSVKGYRTVMVKTHRHPEHRLIWLMFYGSWPSGQIDHINGIKNDNRIANLRDVSQSENLQNQHRAHRNSKSGLLGARFDKRRKQWCAAIRLNKKDYWLGYFDTAELAHKAYVAKKKELHPTSAIAKATGDQP